MSGFSDRGLASFGEAMCGVVDDGTVPGVVTVLARGADVHLDAYGVADVATGAALGEDALFRIQSMTKPVLAAATMQLVERGGLALDSPVERWLPELANRVVLRTPGSGLDDVVPAKRPITVEDLLTCRCGYGAVFAGPDDPIARAMRERGLEPGPQPRLEPSEAWLARLAELPLIHQPGEGWRYHTSFDILGILISRVSGTGLGDHLAEHVLDPLGMADTAMFVSGDRARRLVAAYRHGEDGRLVEDEPAGGGYHVATPPFDVSHGELVATARDYQRFAAMLLRGGELDGVRLLSEASVAAMTRDHIDPAQKTDDAFFPGFWQENGWGYGMAVTVVRDVHGEAGRYSWMGGYGTAWFNDPGTGLIGIALMQVLLDEATMRAVDTFLGAAYRAVA